MSVFGKIPEIADAVKRFDDDVPLMTVESDEKLNIEHYKSIRLFTENEISIDFDDFCLNIEGTKLVMNEFTPSMISITGKIMTISYLSRRTD